MKIGGKRDGNEGEERAGEREGRGDGERWEESGNRGRKRDGEGVEEEREMEKGWRKEERWRRGGGRKRDGEGVEEEREMEKGWRKEENRAGVKVLCQHHCTQHGRSVIVNAHMRMWHYTCKVGAILKLTS